MPDIMQYIWPLTTLVIFGGMLALCWKALNIAHDLAQIVLKSGLAQPGQVPQVLPIPKSVPVVPSPPIVPAPTPPTPEVPDEAVDVGLVNFIKKQEGYSAKAYWDFKQYTIGYGTKANSATEVIDEAEAERRLRAEIVVADKLVTNFAPGLPKGIHQALLDLTYNAGSGWEHQSLGAAVKAAKWDTVKADILQYNHAGGQVNAALTKRREAEVSWFDNPL
jgi:GH24 family phage-related lysozyme (muramidase)